MAYATRESSAYQSHELPAKPPVQEPERNFRTISSPRISPLFRFKSLATVALIIVVAAMIVHAQMSITRLTVEIGAANEQIEKLSAQNVALEAKQVNALSGEALDEYATVQLGMVKLDGSQIEYVELSNPDRIEIEGEGNTASGAMGGLVSCFNAILEYLG